MKAREKRTDVTVDRVVKELGKVGFASIADFASWKSNKVTLKDSDQLSDDLKAAVSEIKEKKNIAGSSVELKLHCKLGALDKLARHLGMYDDNMNLNINTEEEQGNPVKVEDMDDDELNDAIRDITKG